MTSCSKREVETLPESDLRGMYTQLRENQNCFMHQAALAETAVAAVAEVCTDTPKLSAH